jgi:ribosome biogenesis GTPase A
MRYMPIITKIEKYAEPNVQLCALGNKSDSDVRKVETDRLEEFSSRRKIPVFEVSAKNGDKIYQAFMNMARELIKLHPKVEKQEPTNKVIENIKKKKSDFKLKSGADAAEPK